MKRWIFDAHIALCKDCQNYIAGYKRTIELSQQVMTPESLFPLPKDLVSAILYVRNKV